MWRTRSPSPTPPGALNGFAAVQVLEEGDGQEDGPLGQDGREDEQGRRHDQQTDRPGIVDGRRQPQEDHRCLDAEDDHAESENGEEPPSEQQERVLEESGQGGSERGGPPQEASGDHEGDQAVGHGEADGAEDGRGSLADRLLRGGKGHQAAVDPPGAGEQTRPDEGRDEPAEE